MELFHSGLCLEQWNGVSEQRNSTLLDMVRSMMSQTDLPIAFWGYALETAAFTLNRVPTKSVEKAPYEMWTRKHPGLSLWDIRGKPNDIICIIKRKAKCLLLAMVSS